MASVQTCCSICILVPFLASCAASPKEAASEVLRAPTEPETAAVATSAPVVDLSKQSANAVENTGQVCKEILKPNSNMIINVCGTPAQWKVFKAAQERQAQEFLSRMQGMRR
jgi:hypothetical protein